MFAWLYFNPPRILFTIPYLNFAIYIYSLLFAVGFIGGYYLFYHSIKKHFYYFDPKLDPSLYTVKARAFADKVLFCFVLATLIGARLGHMFFYESPMRYLQNPLEILNFRQGGLASHGAAVAIIIALIVLARKIKKKIPNMSFISLLDMIAMPTAFAAIWIRVGNFINQEILGIPSHMPWAVIFANPFDGSLPVPRHPAQLYEAICYLFTFILLFLAVKKKLFLFKGRIIGLFFICIFTSRFFIEFFKEEQSFFANLTYLNMGQLLSIPFVLIGSTLVLLSYSRYKRVFSA